MEINKCLIFSESRNSGVEDSHEIVNLLPYKIMTALVWPAHFPATFLSESQSCLFLGQLKNCLLRCYGIVTSIASQTFDLASVLGTISSYRNYWDL